MKTLIQIQLSISSWYFQTFASVVNNVNLHKTHVCHLLEFLSEKNIQHQSQPAPLIGTEPSMKLSCDSTWMYRVKIIYLYKSLCLYHLRLRTLGQQITITMKPLALCGTLTERRTSRTKLVSTRTRRMLFSGSSRRKLRCSRNSWKMAVVSMANPCLDILSFCKYAFKILNSRTRRNYKGYRMSTRDEMQMVLVQWVCTCFNQDPTRRREFQESTREPVQPILVATDLCQSPHTKKLWKQ